MSHRPGSLHPSVAELDASAIDEFTQLRLDRIVDRRTLVVGQRLAPDLARARRRVTGAALGPAVEILRRGEQRAVEALAKTLERVRGPEEVPAGPDLDVRVEREARLVDLERSELVAELAQQLDIDDELLIAGDEAALE